MIGWLRALSPGLRRSLYFVGVIAAFFVAVGVGAAATIVAGQHFGQVATGPGGASVLAGTGSGEMSALEGTSVETTGPAEAPESTRVEPPEDSNDSNATGNLASFVHRADRGNTRQNFTYLSDTNIDGKANAVIIVSAIPKPEGDGVAPYGHNIGVWYEPGAKKWAIFNQDQTSVPTGAAFEVVVPQPSEGFVHRAEPSDTVDNATYLYGPATNGKPDAAVSVTQNWNPGGGGGIYNDHPTDVFYDGDVGQWAIYNRDGAPIPEGAAYNVFVPQVAG